MSKWISPNERAPSLSPSSRTRGRERNGGFFKFEQETIKIFEFKVWPRRLKNGQKLN